MVSAPSTSPGAPAFAGRGRLWLGLAGILISVGFLYWALRGVDPAELWADLKGANPGYYLLSVALATLTFPARAFRWRIILASSGGDVPYRPVWHATAIGFMATNLLPARAGELARAYAASRFMGLPLARSIGSIAVERVFDGLIVMLLLALAIATFRVAGAAQLSGRSVSA